MANVNSNGNVPPNKGAGLPNVQANMFVDDMMVATNNQGVINVAQIAANHMPVQVNSAKVQNHSTGEEMSFLGVKVQVSAQNQDNQSQ